MKLKKGSIALLTLAGMFYMSVQKAAQRKFLVGKF